MGDTSTGNGAPDHFTAQSTTAEDLLKSQTTGLVTLADFRKRRAEVIELKEKEKDEAGRSSSREGSSTPQPFKKRKKASVKGKLSFGIDDDDEQEAGQATITQPKPKPRKQDLDTADPANDSDLAINTEASATHPPLRKLGPNTSVTNAPRILTKSAQLREAETRDRLRREFLAMQEAVKATEMALPFVFYDGSNTPGGICRVKKGDPAWLFLDRARKVGAEMGVGGDKSRREWARVGVDDLMLVRDDVIVPHHYEFYYFMINKTRGFNGPLFPFSAEPTAATPVVDKDGTGNTKDYNPLSRPGAKKDTSSSAAAGAQLEGADQNPGLTRVVDRRWYERNKHIFPANTWEEFDPTKDYSTGIRKDTEGNAFFF